MSEHMGNPRRVMALSWWIAAELASRHPKLVVHEHHPCGGMYDCLSLFHQQEPLASERWIKHADLNRAGSLHGSDKSLSWNEVFAIDNPVEMIDRIEKHAGLTGENFLSHSVHDLDSNERMLRVERTYRENARTALDFDHLPLIDDSVPMCCGWRDELDDYRSARQFSYQFLAAVLSLQLHDPAYWDVRNEKYFGADAGYEPGDDLRGYVNQFESVMRGSADGSCPGLYDHVPTEPRDKEPHIHFWGVLRDDELVLVVSEYGWVYLPDRMLKLTDEVVERLGGMQRLAMEVLAARSGVQENLRLIKRWRLAR